jgi:hypothetical protein
MAGMKETAGGARGTKIVRDFARDDSSCDVKNPHGKALGGSTTNVSHSLSGASVPNSATGK